jgi:superfamily II DNA/RNA helicase
MVKSEHTITPSKTHDALIIKFVVSPWNYICRGGKLKTGSLQSLVMDEFDALLEYKPHRDPTRAVMQSLKRRHGDALQSILCSATATDVMDSANVVDFLRPGYETAMADQDDVLVTESRGGGNTKSGRGSAGAIQVSRTVLHGVVHLPHRRLALDAVRKILHTEPIPHQILIFVENARKVDIVVEKLGERGIIAAPLHGGMGSEKMDRAEVSKALREGYVGIVVATELAARGLDAPLLTHVINLDLPTDASHYAHRAGRCGRGGRPGVVINMTTQPKERNVPQRFADDLRVEMHTIEPRGGKLLMVDPASQILDASPP